MTFHQCAIDGTHSPVITCVLLPRCELRSFDIASLHRTNISFATSRMVCQRQRNRFNVLILKIIESRKYNRASRIREMMMKNENEKQKRAKLTRKKKKKKKRQRTTLFLVERKTKSPRFITSTRSCCCYYLLAGWLVPLRACCAILIRNHEKSKMQ